MLLHDVIDDMSEVVRLLESRAPYHPLGGWFSPGADPHARTRPMWFQNDWVHDTFHAPGADLFLRHPRYLGGPAHTDNHGMFHQVAPIGPFDAGTRRVSPSAVLEPARDGTDDWTVTDHGMLELRSPLDAIRVSVRGPGRCAHIGVRRGRGHSPNSERRSSVSGRSRKGRVPAS